MSLEARLVDLADEIAYTGHDCEDGLRAGLFTTRDLGGVALAREALETTRERGTSLRGGLIHQGREYRALSVAFVQPQEGRMELVAGSEGLDVLVLNFPRSSAARPAQDAVPKAARGEPGTRVWQCLLCAFVYDEAKGLPDEGIAPGTPWEAVPEDWYCPDCSAGKSDFQMALVG